MKKQVNALLAALLLAVGSVTLPVSAEEITATLGEGDSLIASAEPNEEDTVRKSGSCGTYMTYTWYTNGDMLISGTGDMVNYTKGNYAKSYNDSEAPPWHGYYYSYENYYPFLEIYTHRFEGRITGIGDYIFSYCRNIMGELSLPITQKG